jgi:membrane-bound serine protease (ClpP class)
MVLGALMLINTRLPGGSVSLPTALSVALPFALITIFLLRLVIRARHGKVTTGEAGMIGEIGRVEHFAGSRGKIYVHGELWEAVSTKAVSRGDMVRVRAVDGLTLYVEPVSNSYSSVAATETDAVANSSHGQETPKGA